MLVYHDIALFRYWSKCFTLIPLSLLSMRQLPYNVQGILTLWAVLSGLFLQLYRSGWWKRLNFKYLAQRYTFEMLCWLYVYVKGCINSTTYISRPHGKLSFNWQLMHSPVYTHSPAQHLKCVLVLWRMLFCMKLELFNILQGLVFQANQTWTLISIVFSYTFLSGLQSQIW